jgi:pimeloyl-ACP methyl ester carboxylesterase
MPEPDRQPPLPAIGHALACGHFLAEERPDDIVDALQRFLS